MLDKFNFYDVYGYLLPGGLLAGLVWLPFGVLLGKWPSADWTSAILALGLAYIVGHILRVLSARVFSARLTDKQRNMRMPSDLFVAHDGDKVLPSGARSGNLKYRLAAQIAREFGTAIDVDTAWNEALGTRRDVAFFKCRAYLTKNNAAVYAEQQEGMYALIRSLRFPAC